MILKKTYLIQFLFFVFLLLHSLPLVFNENYPLIIIFNYSIILFSLIVCSFNNKKMTLLSIVLISLIFISITMSVLGFSGSISSLIMAASLPHFLLRNINSERDFLKLFYKPIMISTFLLMLCSMYLYIDVKDILDSYYLGEYFTIASINFVPLVFFSFSVLQYLLFRVDARKAENKKLQFIFLISFILITMFFSSIFFTRSVFVCSLILLYASFKKGRILILLSVPIAVIYNIDIIMPIITNFLGSDNLLDIVSDYRRSDSITNMIKSSLRLSFDFSNQASYSSLINLLFSLFPFTLVFLYNPLSALISIVKVRDITLLLVFSSCLVLVFYQMDFFSIFTFFFFMEYIKIFINEKHAI